MQLSKFIILGFFLLPLSTIQFNFDPEIELDPNVALFDGSNPDMLVDMLEFNFQNLERQERQLESLHDEQFPHQGCPFGELCSVFLL